MSDILQRLERLRDTIQDADFMEGRGLANEVNLRIFSYAPEDELAVRQWVESRRREKHLRCRLHVCNLYGEFLATLQEKEVLEACSEVEERDGREELLQALRELIKPSDMAGRIVSREDLQPGADVLLICGVGEIFPFLRVHSLLEALQPLIPNRLPVVVMYPGKYDGHYLQLFNKLAPNGYYRAFNLICDQPPTP